MTRVIFCPPGHLGTRTLLKYLCLHLNVLLTRNFADSEVLVPVSKYSEKNVNILQGKLDVVLHRLKTDHNQQAVLLQV